jgi:hypothetical protein
MVKKRKKPRIYTEKAKREHTTHWDMDYLPVEEVEALYGLNAKPLPDATSNDQSIPSAARWLVVSLIAVALVAIVVALIRYLV